MCQLCLPYLYTLIFIPIFAFLQETFVTSIYVECNTILCDTNMTKLFRCWVSGWGKDAFGDNGKYQSILKEVDVPIINQDNCQTTLRNTRLGQFFVLDKSFLCAGGEAGKDACTVRKYVHYRVFYRCDNNHKLFILTSAHTHTHTLIFLN